MPKRKTDAVQLSTQVEKRRRSSRHVNEVSLDCPSVGESQPGPSQSLNVSVQDQCTEPQSHTGNSTCLNLENSEIGLDFNLSSQLNMPHQITSIHSDIGVNVSESIRLKITSGLYVDLAALIQPDHMSESIDNKLTVNQSGELVLRPLGQKKKILDIESWTDAFITYSSIYLAAHPEKNQDVLKYMNTIRTGAKRHGGMGWKSYDEQFRLRLASNQSYMSFGKIDYELWLLYMNTVEEVSNHRLSSGKNKCYDFNYKFCTRVVCPYLHACLHCGLTHPSRFCNGMGRQTFGQRMVRGHTRFTSQGPQLRPNFKFGQFAPRF